ncbi:MAG: adenylate/guanylate cyclase domain-containing protein, partial [marine benthic group bacterium]|nr:adenylate/guanylate cyclase domain-containing protein [Gemmatimonadota bacterium]
LSRQSTYRADLIDPSIANHHGRVVKGTGDGLLAEFAGAVDAVECAAEIQRAMPDLEKDVPSERKIQFRIGINVGDIVAAEDGDIYGEGVNVAARIESLADHGGVFISESAFNQVKNKVELGFEDMGLQSVKNIEEPVHVYRVMLELGTAGSLPGQRRKGGFKRQLLRRRVPQFVGLFLVSSWAFLEFISFAVEQYGLSPLLPTFVLSLLLLLIPTVLWLAWYHGARGPDGWTRADAVFLSGNLVAAAAILFLPGWFEIGDLTTRNLERRDARQTRESALESLEDTEDPRNIAVLYFEPRSPQEEVPYLAAGLTEALINELSTVDALDVTSRNGSALFRGAVVSTDSIGRVLRVGTLVDGTVALSEGQVQVDVALVRAATGEAIRRQQLRRPRAELFQLQTELATQVAFFLREMLGEEVELIERQTGAENVEAWELLQQARAQSDLATQLADEGDEAAWDRMEAADSLLAMAEDLAPEWVEPTVRRGWLAYQRSRWAGVMEQGEVLPWIETGLEHAEIALSLDPENSDALELRGTLRYWQWIMDLVPGIDEANTLFDGAEADLRQAALVNPGQAGSWAALSHLLLNKDQMAEAKMAATRAYEADAYLRTADVILWRLFSTSYDLQDQVDAAHWCRELGRRFPGDDRFAECRLWLMTMHGGETNVDSAWAHAADMVRLRSPQTEEFNRRWAGMAVAAVLARAGMEDSAAAVADRSRGDATVDPIKDIAYAEAFVRTLLDDYDTAVDLLAEYMAVSGRDPSDIDYWWFTPLAEIPRYQMLLGP